MIILPIEKNFHGFNAKIAFFRQLVNHSFFFFLSIKTTTQTTSTTAAIKVANTPVFCVSETEASACFSATGSSFLTTSFCSLELRRHLQRAAQLPVKARWLKGCFS